MEPVGGTPMFERRHTQLVDQSVVRAEEIIGDRYRLASFGPTRYLYDVVTLRHQKPEERAPGAFAHLIRYARSESGPDSRRLAGHFYRICLQDDGILATFDRPDLGFGLSTLLLYIMTHELIHIVRFEQFEIAFEADEPARSREERIVHGLTYEVLEPLADPSMQVLLEHYRRHAIPRCF